MNLIRYLGSVMAGILALAWLLPMAVCDSAHAAPAAANPEIERLLQFVGTANVRFIRNGTEYSSLDAAVHLREKLAKAGNRVKTAEEFIEGIASKSYLSGQPYLVKFSDGHTEPAGTWLRQRLNTNRQQHP